MVIGGLAYMSIIIYDPMIHRATVLEITASMIIYVRIINVNKIFYFMNCQYRCIMLIFGLSLFFNI